MEIINLYACKYSVDPRLASNLAYAESSMDPYSVGSRGERGLFQITPDTWAWLSFKVFGKKVPFYMAYDPETNIEMATWYLRWISDSLGEKYSQAAVLCAYNMGLGRLRQRDFKVPFSHKNNIYDHYFKELKENNTIRILASQSNT